MASSADFHQHQTIVSRCYRELRTQISEVDTPEELQRLVNNHAAYVPVELRRVVFESLLFPEVFLKWGQLPLPGQNCCPAILVVPSRFYARESPHLSLFPPEQLRDGFRDSRYLFAEIPGTSSPETAALTVPLLEGGQQVPGGWIGMLPFQVPGNGDAVRGEQLFRFWLNFPGLWKPLPRFFEMVFRFAIEEVAGRASRTLTIRGGTTAFHGDLRRFDHVILEGDGAKDVRQILPALLEDEPDSEPASGEVHALQVVENRRISLPVVHSSGSRNNYAAQLDAMLTFDQDDTDHRQFFFRTRELRLGRDTEKCEIPLRFVPSIIPESMAPDSPDLADRQLNRSASERISRTHLIVNAGESEVSLINCVNDEGAASRTRLGGVVLKANERQLVPVNCLARLELGGSRTHPDLPVFEMKVRVSGRWEDENSMGIPAVDSALKATCDTITGSHPKPGLIDSVILSWGRERRQAFVTCVMVRRQVFLDVRGRVVENPATARAGLAVRIFHSGQYFFAQTVANSEKLEFTVDGMHVPQYDVVLLQPGSQLDFRRGQTQLAHGEWGQPRFRNR